MSVKNRTKAAFKSAQATVQSKAVALVELVDGAKTASLNRCVSVKASVVSAWADFNKRGARLFVADALKTARGLVQEYVVLCRVELVDRYQQLSALTSRRYVDAKTQAMETSQDAKERASMTYGRVSARTTETIEFTKAKGQVIRSSVAETASDKQFQVTAGAAAGGAVAGGVSGGAVGLTTGSAVGAIVGLVPAVFTFGLSIPIGAAIGGGAGLLFGVAAGATTGAIGGGVTGRAAYNRKDDIASSASACAEYVKGKAAVVKGQAYASSEFMKEKASSVKIRFVEGTGGTEARCD